MGLSITNIIMGLSTTNTIMGSRMTFQSVNNKGADQPVHMCRLISTFIVRMQQIQVFSLQGPW